MDRARRCNVRKLDWTTTEIASPPASTTVMLIDAVIVQLVIVQLGIIYVRQNVVIRRCLKAIMSVSYFKAFDNRHFTATSCRMIRVKCGRC